MNIGRVSLSAIAALVLVLMSVAIVAVPSSPTQPTTNPESAEALLQQGIQLYQADKVEAAIQTWQQARKVAQQRRDQQREGTVLAHLGMAYVQLERYQDAIAVLENFSAVAQAAPNRTLEAQALGNLGIAYKSLGQYAKAIATHRRAGKLMLALGHQQGLGQVLSNLGGTFEAVGDYTSAMSAFQQSLKIAQQTGDRVGEIISLGNLGAIHADQGQDQAAIALFQQSLDLAKAANHLPGQTSALLNLGSTHHSLRQLETAISFYDQSLKLAQTIGDRQREAEALGALGLAYEDQKNFAAAIQQHQKSLAIGRSLNNPELQGRALNNLGHALFNAGKLKEAETTLRQAIQLLDALRPDLTDRYRVSIFDTQIHTYSLLQQVLIAARQYDAALEAAEWGRARAFAERLARRVRNGRTVAQAAGRQQASTATASPQPGITPIRMAQIRRIAREQRATLVEYAIVPDDDFKFRGKQRGRESELLIWVVQPSGQLHFRRVNLKPLWQQDLNLEKLVMASRNCLVPGADCRGVTIPAINPRSRNPGRSVGQSTGSQSAVAVTPPKRRVNPALRQLHQLLIEPIADLLPTKADDRIILLPLESLFLIPFPALQAADGTYLVEQHTMLTAPAIQVLALTRQIKLQRRQTTGRDRFLPALIVGNPTMPTIDAQELAELPAAETEANQVAALLQVKALTGREATQAKVTQQMTQAALVHLATHGLLEYGQELGDTDLPGAIALAPNPTPSSDSTPNGILTASEILELPLKANLVVLSACDTGRGRITGDGVQGLSRAFISAGVPSLVVSLWAVSDTSTAHLMVQFYEKLLQQPDKAKALRLAMSETMKQYPRPLDWAAFTLVGEAE